MMARKGFGVLQAAAHLKAKEDLRESRKPIPTWPPLEPLGKLHIKAFPLSLKARLAALVVLKQKCQAEVLAQVVREGLKIVENSGDMLQYKPSSDFESA